MKEFQAFLDGIDRPDRAERMTKILSHVQEKFPQLKPEVKWNQPMFTDHGTFIVGFSVAEGHIAVAPEPQAIALFAEEIQKAGYSHTRGLFRIRWTDEVNWELIDKIVSYNIHDKKDMTKFWR